MSQETRERQASLCEECFGEDLIKYNSPFKGGETISIKSMISSKIYT